jgi:drug/metabolite transporter (DMT)-like permease
MLTVASGVLALSVSHIIWYTGVQRLGSARTSVYSNLVPVVAMAIAAVWLREPIGAAKIAGAALVLTGLLLTRVGQHSGRV